MNQNYSKIGNESTVLTLNYQNEGEILAHDEMSNTDAMGKVDSEIMGKSVKENEILRLPRKEVT
jgi:hypothetical protein